MKLPYIKPLRFPVWSKINEKLTGNKRYSLYEDGVFADFRDDSLLAHSNHIEMSGFSVSSIVSYKIDEKREPQFYRFCVFPQCRVIPNDTRGSLTYAFKGVDIKCGGNREKIEKVFFDGTLNFVSTLAGLTITRCFTPARDKKALIEEIKISSLSDFTLLTFLNNKPAKDVKGYNTVDGMGFSLTTSLFVDGLMLDSKEAKISIKKGETVCYAVYAAEALSLDEVKEQIILRRNFINDIKSRLSIKTPNMEINRMLEFTKLRACESIFMTKNGLMHAPGGGGYYAALWTNDQCEYANPFFAYLGYDKACEQSLNCYNLYSDLASETKAIYTSIVAEGDGYWHGAGDRGDSSMYIYGLSRYLLTTGDKKMAQKFLPSLEKALTYVKTKITSDNIVLSDSDELENRFESGKANLSTAVITYDAFISLSYIEKELGYEEKSNELMLLAEKIKNGIESYFGASVEGYDTYKYCDEETNLRSWICLPLTVGIDNRKEDTINAILSNKLRMGNGILTRSGEKTYWDRSTLYAMRGMFYVGESERAMELMKSYVNERLFGEHVPYPVEAYPEGNAAHLSAESALYVRIFTEGVLGYRPTGFNSFELKPNLPKEWNTISFNKMNLFGEPSDITVNDNGEEYEIIISKLKEPVKVKKGKKYIFSY